MRWGAAPVTLSIRQFGVNEPNRDFSTTCKGSEKDWWTAEQTDFTKGLDMATIFRAGAEAFKLSAGDVS